MKQKREKGAYSLVKFHKKNGTFLGVITPFIQVKQEKNFFFSLKTPNSSARIRLPRKYKVNPLNGWKHHDQRTDRASPWPHGGYR